MAVSLTKHQNSANKDSKLDMAAGLIWGVTGFFLGAQARFPPHPRSSLAGGVGKESRADSEVPEHPRSQMGE